MPLSSSVNWRTFFMAKRTVVPWSANLFLIPGLVCLVLKRFEAAAICGYAAAMLAAASWFINRQRLIGYYLWQLSFVVLAVGSHHAFWVGRQTNKGGRRRSPSPAPTS